APNSDSTIRIRQLPTRPSPTRSDRPSTMWVCGEIGYAATTSGRQRATVSAIARDPSTCFSMAHPLRSVLDQVEAVGRELGVEVARVAGEAVAHGQLQGGQVDHPGESGEGTEQAGVGQRAAEALPREVARRH